MPDTKGIWRDYVPPLSLIEDDVAPAPWEYDPRQEVVKDADGYIIIRGARALVCERLVRAVNEMARKDNIIT